MGRGLPRRAGVVVCALVVLPATACLTTDAEVTIDADGSGQLRVEVVPPVEVADAVEAINPEVLVETAIDGIDGASFESFRQRGQYHYELVIPFDDYRTLSDDLTEGATVGGSRLTPFSSFDLRELPDGGWQLNAVTNPITSAADFTDGSALGILQELAATEDAGAGLELSITLPGRITGSNADSLEAGTANWTIDDPDAAQTLELTTEADPLLTPLQMVLVGLLGVFLLGGLLMFLGASGPPRRRRMAATSHRSGWEKPATQPKEPQTPPTWGGARPAVSLPPLPDGESDPLPPEQMKATSHTTPLHRQELLAPGPAGGPDSSEEDTAAPTAQDCEDEPE